MVEDPFYFVFQFSFNKDWIRKVRFASTPGLVAFQEGHMKNVMN
jgi:hypothetical protein